MQSVRLLVTVWLAVIGATANPQGSTAHLIRPRVPESHAIHERRHESRAVSWSAKERAPATMVLPVRVGLKQQNLDLGHELLMDISHPKSKKYGKHLTSNEIISLFEPAQESVVTVWNWIVSSGFSPSRMSRSRNKQWIQFDATVEEIEELLFAEFHIFEHNSTGALDIACSEYHLPKAVKEHVDYITPGIKLMTHGQVTPMPNRVRSRRQLSPRVNVDSKAIVGHQNVKGMHVAVDDVDCRDDLVPDCIREQYGVPRGTKAHPSNKLGIFQSLGQHYNQEDLDDYFKAWAPEITAGTHPEHRLINGALGPTTNRSQSGAEAALDFELAMPLVWPQGTVLWQLEDEYYQKNQSQQNTIYKGFFNNLWNAMDGSYCNFSAFGETGNCKRPECLDPVYPNPAEGGYKGEVMCGVYEPTNVISISYSGAEIDLPYSYHQRQCAEVMKLGLQGITVVSASGDNGVGSFEGDPTPSGCLGPKEDVFNPEFISNCPYVLAVGATELQLARRGDRAVGDFTERATRDFPSGGGFSNIFETPAWQKPHVDTYLEVTGPKLGFDSYVGGGSNYSNVGVLPGKFNRAGRATPDISAVGAMVRTIYGGRWRHLMGTSASAPIMASLLNLINEERLATNKTPVGFVHQVLYEHPEIFTDVTVGSNPNCKTRGFQAADGWDPVTGLGTPKYQEMLKLFMSLP